MRDVRRENDPKERRVDEFRVIGDGSGAGHDQDAWWRKARTDKKSNAEKKEAVNSRRSESQQGRLELKDAGESKGDKDPAIQEWCTDVAIQQLEGKGRVLGDNCVCVRSTWR